MNRAYLYKFVLILSGLSLALFKTPLTSAQEKTPRLVVMRDIPGLVEEEAIDAFLSVDLKGGHGLLRSGARLPVEQQLLTVVDMVAIPEEECDFVFEAFGLCENQVLGEIDQTLQQNLGDEITDFEREQLAEWLLGYFDGGWRNFLSLDETIILGTEGITKTRWVGWPEDIRDGRAIFVRGGSDGDIMVLGRFMFREIKFLGAYAGRYTLTTDPLEEDSSYLFAIVWTRE